MRAFHDFQAMEGFPGSTLYIGKCLLLPTQWAEGNLRFKCSQAHPLKYPCSCSQGLTPPRPSDRQPAGALNSLLCNSVILIIKYWAWSSAPSGFWLQEITSL